MRVDWIEIEISKIGRIFTGNTPPKKNIENYNSNDFPFYKPTDLEAGKNVIKSNDYLSKTGYENSRIATSGSILVTCIGATIGKTGLVKKNGGFNQQINAVIPFHKINSSYIYYQIIGTEFQNQIIKNASSTTLPILNKNKFSQLKLKLAPLPEQRAVVSKIEQLFSELDNGIANLKSAKEKLEIYRQAVLKKAFEGKLTNRNLKDGELPNGWKWASIGDICDMKAGFFVKADNIEKEYKEALFPCYGGNGLRGYINSFTHEGKYSLVGRQGALCGNVHLVKGTFHATEHAIVTSPKEGINTEWLYYKLTEMQLNKYSSGAAQPGLSVNKLLKIEVCYPPVSEQELIVFELESKFTACYKISDSLNESLEKSEALRQSILKKAFSGKLLTQKELEACKQEADWEPAEKLLERIEKA